VGELAKQRGYSLHKAKIGGYFIVDKLERRLMTSPVVEPHLVASRRLRAFLTGMWDGVYVFAVKSDERAGSVTCRP
jgi:hypothetical protein